MGNGAAARMAWHRFLAAGCAVLSAPILLLSPRPATAADAEEIYRLTHYDLTMNSVATGSLAGADRQIYYADMDYNDRGDRNLLPDRLEASGGHVAVDGTVTADSGTLYITSLLEGQTITAQADSIIYDTNDGKAELSGNVLVELAGTGLRLECTELYYDPLMEIIEVTGVEFNLPLNVLVDEEQLRGGAPRARFGGHFYLPAPDHVRMTSSRARLDINPLHESYVLYDAKLSYNDIPDPDLYIHADELSFLKDGRMAFTNISVHMSGITLITWPHLSYAIDHDPGLYGTTEPKIRFEKGVGIAWKQGVNFELKDFYALAMFDYSPEYGLRDEYTVYTRPFKDSYLALEYGERSEYDIDRVTVERRTDYNLRYQQIIPGDGHFFREASLRLEYGQMTATKPRTITAPTIVDEDRRLFAAGEVELPLIPLGENWYVTSGMTGRYVKYFDNGIDYRAIGGYGGFIWRQGSFDHFIVYRSHQVTDEPVFSFDEIRGRELDFMTSFRLHPQWRHVVRAIYNVDDEELNQLAVSMLKRQKSYEIGLFWDFARESAGLELGLLVE